VLLAGGLTVASAARHFRLLAKAVARLPNLPSMIVRPVPLRTGSIDFNLTTSDGWTYSGTLPLPSATLSVSSNIKASPPGQAQVQLKLKTSDVVPTLTFSDTNPGRPDGPKLTVAPGIFAFEVPTAVMGPLSSDMLDSSGDASIDYTIGPCQLYAPYQGFWPYPDPTYDGDGSSSYGSQDLTCSPANGTGTEPYSVPEADVTALASALHDEQPAYVINLDPYLSACNEIIYPSGQTAQAPDFADNGCAALTISVSK
jgi:hypothetical protein